MRRSEIERDIILWKRRSQQLLGRLTAFTPPSEFYRRCLHTIFFFGHLMFLSPYARTRTYHAIVSLRVYRSIKGEITYRAVFGKLKTGSKVQG
jgi:hypothetical protein